MNKSAVNKSDIRISTGVRVLKFSEYTDAYTEWRHRDMEMSVVECVRSLFRANRERILDGGPRVELKGR